ncbi:dynein-related AAA-type ATPase, putative [Plasmodium ovale wallikeri]|uniref:Midasin n=1 Tax=Plasmodium ovale wallikeri TaxID=864142 RepID=A0A1A8ZN64_PLAOA|nr:dynein-related AAA-type ATPase, putative [Plasmodium ovale wallikeri]SBT45305.1 dynein-related AAA-type ATPase, putative [Plasmodium ovale wallikeri]
MTNVEDNTTRMWCEEIIKEIRKRKGKGLCKKKEEQTLPIKRNVRRKSKYVQSTYVKHIYKNCRMLQKYFNHKLYDIQFGRRKLVALSRSVYFGSFNVGVGHHEKGGGLSVNSPIDVSTDAPAAEAVYYTPIGDDKRAKIPLSRSVHFVHTFDSKYRRDLVITQTLVLTFFEPSLLKISLKFFNLLMISLINQLFQEVLYLSMHDYHVESDQKGGKSGTCSGKSKEKERNSRPVLHIYNLINKFNVDVDIYFVMICMNSVIFSKELFYNNTIDHFFKNVFARSKYCYNYIKGVVEKYVHGLNGDTLDARAVRMVYYVHCCKVMLLFYYLSVNNALNHMYLDLLPQVLKCKRKNPFFETLVYLTYMKYYSIESRTLGESHIKGDIFCIQMKRKLRKKRFEQRETSVDNMYSLLLRHKYIVIDFEYLYVEKLRYNVAKNDVIRYCQNIEPVMYPTFHLNIGGKEKNSINRCSFITTKRMRKIVESLVMNIYNKKPTILIGNQGSGKTSLINFLYGQIFQNKEDKEANVISVYLDDVSDSKSILGLWECNEKCFEFKYGILAKAMKKGNWIVFENIDNVSTSIVEKLHELTSKGYIYLSEKGEYIYPHKDFRLFSTITSNRAISSSLQSEPKGECAVDVGTKKGTEISTFFSEMGSYGNSEVSEFIRMNHRPHHMARLFDKWHSVFIGDYSKGEIKEILFKKLGRSVHEKYRNILLHCYSEIKTSLEMYHIFRNINLHDLTKIVKRIRKKKIFIYDCEKTKVHLLRICKSILISHIPNAHLRYTFLIKLVKLFFLNEKSVLTHLKTMSVECCISEFNETMKGRYRKLSLNMKRLFSSSFLLTSVHKSILYDIIEGVYNKESILLVGDTGVGKTALVDYISKLFGKKLHVFVFSEQSEASDLVGNYYPFNISVKTNELFKEMKRLNCKIGSYILEKELGLFYIKLRIQLSEKKYITFLNTCRNFANLVMNSFQNNTKLYDMKIIKRFKHFEENCKNVIDFWNSSTNKTSQNRDYALTFDFDKIFKNGHSNGAGAGAGAGAKAEAKAETANGQGGHTNWESACPNELIFKFHDGILLDCIRNGYWLLLDEINLAQTEILQRLQGLLDSSNKHFDVVEKGNEQIRIHKDFRLFACMNPPFIPNVKKKRSTGGSSNGGKTGDDVVDVGNGTVSSGKKELPHIIRNKFTEIFVDEILELEDVEMIVRHLLKDTTCDSTLIKNISSCYLEIKKESLRNRIDTETKPVFFSTRNLVRAIKYAVYVNKRRFKPLSLIMGVEQGFIANFLSCVNSSNQQILEKIFNKYFNHSQNRKWKVKSSESMQIEKNGIVTCQSLENYYPYEFYHKKRGVSNIHDRERLNGDFLESSLSGQRVPSENVRRGRCNTDVEKYVCVEGSWVLCGNEEINEKKILSNFIITKNVKENIKKLALCLSGIKTPILLEGNTSVGKTSLVKFFADITGHKFIRINNHMNTDMNEYYGQFVNDQSSGNLVFEEGAFVKAVRNGHWVVLDELNLAPSEVLESLNRILDDNKELYIPELKCYVKAHKDFMLFATQNPANNNKYIGRKELSKAFRSRFIEFHINDFEVEELEIILHRRCAISPKISKKMIQVFIELRNMKSNYNYFSDNLMTLRDLIKWGNRYPNSNTEACIQGYYIIAEKLRNEKDKQTVKNILSKNFLSKTEELVIDYENDHDVNALKEAFFRKISRINATQRGDKEKMEKTKGDSDNTDFLVTDPLFGSDDYKRVEYLKNVHFGKSTCRLICLLMKCFKYKESALLIGETGCGKTTSCELLSFVKNLKLNVLNCNESTDVYDIIGSLKLVKNKKEDFKKLKKNCIELYNRIYAQCRDNFASNYLSGIIHEQITEIRKEDFLIFALYVQKKYHLSDDIKRILGKIEKYISNLKSIFIWNDGILVSSLKKGNIFLMDEISLVESSVIERLNSVLEYERTLVLTEKGGKHVNNLKAHDNFAFIGTMNPCGDFGKKEISQTLKNRFTEIYVQSYTYDSDDFYILITKQITFTKEKYIKECTSRSLCNIFKQIEQNKTVSSTVTLSIRDSIKWISLMNIYIKDRIKLHTKRGGKNKDVRVIPGDKLKAYCLRSFYHSGCLILMDGNEDMKAKKIAKDILLKNMENLYLSLNYKGDKEEKNILAECTNETYNFSFERRFLRVNDFCIRFRKKLPSNFDTLLENSHFVFNTPNIKKNLYKIVRAMQLENSILLEGSPGVGKTCIINILAKLTKNKLIRINLSECTDIYDFIGSYFPVKSQKGPVGAARGNPEQQEKEDRVSAENGRAENGSAQNGSAQNGSADRARTAFQYVWKDGKLIECMKKGYWILIDEINLANQQTLEGINSILDHRKEIFIPETNEVVKSHKNFRLFCCQNPYKEGGGRKGLPKSFINRFSKIYFEELIEEDYLCIVQKLYGKIISMDVINRIVRIIFMMKKINVLLSESEGWVWNLRDILRICKFMQHRTADDSISTMAGTVPMPSSIFFKACDMFICSRLTCAEDKQIVRCVITNVYHDCDGFMSKMSEVTTRSSLISLLMSNYGYSHINDHMRYTLEDEEKYDYFYDDQVSTLLHDSHVKNNSYLKESPTCRSSLIMSKDEKIFYTCLSAIRLNIPILLSGKNNSGKTSFVHKLSYIFQKQLFEFSLTNDIDTFDLFGCYEQNSRDNAIRNMEKKIYKLNTLLLRLIFKKENFSDFYFAYFEKVKEKKGWNHFMGKRLKINVMTELSALSTDYISALKIGGDYLQRAQETYSHFVCIANKCKGNNAKIKRFFSKIIHLGKMIDANEINENVYVYNEGDFIKAIKRGHWILMKHLHHSTPSLLDRLNSLFEENGYILLHEFGKKKKIKPHKNFQIFLTLSLEEHYKISKALRNRCLEICFGASSEYVNNSLSLYDNMGNGSIFSLYRTERGVNAHETPFGPFMGENNERDACGNVLTVTKDNALRAGCKMGRIVQKNSYKDAGSCCDFLLRMINFCYCNQGEYNKYDRREKMARKLNDATTRIERNYLSLIKETNVFFYLIEKFFKNVKDMKKNISVDNNGEGLTRELIFLFFNCKGVKTHCTKILDYVNYCYDTFFSMHGVRNNTDVIYFSLILSLTTYIIESLFDEEIVREKKRAMKNINWDNNIKNSINALLNYKFENNLYYIDKYINRICSNFLIVPNTSNVTKSHHWNNIFENTFTKMWYEEACTEGEPSK